MVCPWGAGNHHLQAFSHVSFFWEDETSKVSMGGCGKGCPFHRKFEFFYGNAVIEHCMKMDLQKVFLC